MPTLKETSDWLRADTDQMELGVDRDKNVLRGYVVAQEGPFKSKGRGEFDVPALKKIVSLGNKVPHGLKSRFAHPTLSADGLGKYLGRVKNLKLDSVRVLRNGEPKLLHAVRGDLHFGKVALETPLEGGKPLGHYVMDMAESDPDAISSSLVLTSNQEHRLDPKTKRPMLDASGEPLPPLWRPTALHASDVVDTGDACDGILSAHLSAAGLPDDLVRQASALLDGAFPGESLEVVKSRLHAWVDTYLAYRFGDEGLSGELEEWIWSREIEITSKAKSEPKPETEESKPVAGLSKGVAQMRAILAERGALG